MYCFGLSLCMSVCVCVQTRGSVCLVRCDDLGVCVPVWVWVKVYVCACLGLCVCVCAWVCSTMGAAGPVHRCSVSLGLSPSGEL